MSDFTRRPRWAVACEPCEWRGQRVNPGGRGCPRCGRPVTVRHQAGLFPGRGRTYLLCLQWPEGWARDPDDWRVLVTPDGRRIRFHGQHYTGKSFDVAGRVADHQAGRGGVNYLNAAMALGAVPVLVRTWPLPSGQDWKEWRVKRRSARLKACATNKCGQRRGVGHGMTRECPRCHPPTVR